MTETQSNQEWGVNPDTLVLADLSNASVRPIAQLFDNDFNPTQLADDACLLCAAPDLYQALKTMQHLLKSMDAEIHFGSSVWQMLNAAIAKAEGAE